MRRRRKEELWKDVGQAAKGGPAGASNPPVRAAPRARRDGIEKVEPRRPKRCTRVDAVLDSVGARVLSIHPCRDPVKKSGSCYTDSTVMKPFLLNARAVRCTGLAAPARPLF